MEEEEEAFLYPILSCPESKEISNSHSTPRPNTKYPRPNKASCAEEDRRGQEWRSSVDHQSSRPHYCHVRGKEAVLLVSIILTLALANIPGAAGIDCFKCVSSNGDNPSCEDPFHNNFTLSILESPCMGGRKGRNGLFPATACIKLAGRYSDTGERMVVRTCAVDSGTLTLDTELARMSHCGFFYLDDRESNICTDDGTNYDTGETITVRGCALDSGTLNVDTEIIRMSHCGHFWFNDRYVKGCLQSCDDADGCNGSSKPASITALLITSITIPLIPHLGSIGRALLRVKLK